MHDLPPANRPTRELNVLWLLLILLMVTSSVYTDDEAAAERALEKRLTGLRDQVCETLPGKSVFTGFFGDAEGPHLTKWNSAHQCQWSREVGDRTRRLSVEVRDNHYERESLGASKPYLSLAGLGDRAILAGPRLSAAGGLTLRVRAGETTLVITAVDQVDIELETYGAVAGPSNHRHLIQTLTDTAIESLKIVDPSGSADAEPLPSVDTNALPESLCDAVSVPGRALRSQSRTWPPTDRVAGLCSWRSDSDDRDSQAFFVRVDPVTAVPAADATETETAEWLWKLADPEAGDPAPEFGEDAVIGVDKDFNIGGLNIRRNDTLVQVFYNGKDSGDEDVESILTKAARQTIRRLE